MKYFAALFLVLTVAIIFSGDTATSRQNVVSLNTDVSYYNYIQPTYTEYLNETQKWMVKNRTFISSDHDRELEMNMPFELSPKTPTNKAILLVHGLGDSPYSFSDIAPSLVKQGFYVQVLLLPGHGSKPEDLEKPSYADWQNIVDHYANLLKTEYTEVWLGDFSTGANLATIHTIENGGIDGLLLFSPGFISRTPWLEKFAPMATLFTDGYSAAEKNIARYTSAPLNGAIAYSKSASKVRELFKKHEVSVPTLIVLSEADSIIDPRSVLKIYNSNFKNRKNRLVWYGENHFDSSSIQSLTMHLNDVKISTGSHMNPLFAPANPYYGQNGERRMCMNSFDNDAVARCEAGDPVWFSAWGYEEDGKIHARLTWNPYYAELEKSIQQVTK